MPKKGLKKGKKGKKAHKKSTKKGKKASASGDTGSAANDVSTRLQPSAHYQDVCDFLMRVCLIRVHLLLHRGIST